MFSPTKGSIPRKTNCVSCGAPSKWLCQGCNQWYCQECAPNGLCPTHFEMLDSEDREAVTRAMNLFSTKLKKLPILMGLTIIPAIIVFIMLGFFVEDIFLFVIIPIVILGMIISFFIVILPLRKELPRLKQMARKYDFTSKPIAGSFPSGSPLNEGPKVLSESPPVQPMSNIEAVRRKFEQQAFPSVSGIGGDPTKVASLFSLKFLCYCFVFLLIVAGVILGFIFIPNL